MKEQTYTGQVIEALPSCKFRVEFEIYGRKETIICYLAGKMRMNRIRVIPGDRVAAVVEGNLGRIVRRL